MTDAIFWIVLIAALTVFELGLDTLLGRLNQSRLASEPPSEFAASYSVDDFQKSKNYFLATSLHSEITRTVSFFFQIFFWGFGGFAWLKLIAERVTHPGVIQGLLFVGLLMGLRLLLSIPFSVYATFVIEERFGFNRTTPRTFILDLAKGLVLGALIGGAALAGVFWFFGHFPKTAWLWSWFAVTCFSVGLSFLAPAILMPLFNRFEPLQSGPLRDAIQAYAASENFLLEGVYVMDGSKRSAKSNAFFAGFGRFRRLVLFDTLIATQSESEIVAVVAHEIGHFKKGHIPRGILLQTATSFFIFLIFGQLIRLPALYAAFLHPSQVLASIPIAPEANPQWLGLVFASLISSPVLRLASVGPNALSRKYEFEADRYSIDRYREPNALISALKKLSRENFAHLTPHPLKVVFDYSHPPVIERIRAIRARMAS